MTIRSHLVTLVVVALVPVLIFAVIVVLRLNREERVALELATTQTAQALLAALDRELARSLTSLDVLAFSRHLDHDDLRGFYDDARSLLGSHPDWTTISLASPRGEHLINAIFPYGATPAALPDAASVRLVADTRRPGVGSVRLGPLSGKPQFPVRVPVVRDGAAKYVLTALITTTAIDRLLQEQGLPAKWVGAIVDAKGLVVAHTRASEQAVGQPAGALAPPPELPAPTGWIDGVMVDGSRSYVKAARSLLSGWTVALAVPAAVVDGPLRRSLWSVAGAGLLFTLAGAVAAMLVGRRIARPLVTLSTAAETLGRGESPLIPHTPVVEVDQVGGAFAAAAAQRGQADAALRESEARFRTMVVEAESRRREAEVIAQLSRTINASLDSDTVLQAVAHAAKELLACELTRIALWDERREAMVYRYTVGTRYTAYARMRLEPGKGLVGAVITTGQPIRTDDVLDDPRSNPDYFVMAQVEGIVSGMVVPICVRSRVEGVIYFAHRSRRPFTDQDEVIGMRLADHAGVALQNAHLYQREQRARAEAEAANRSKDEFLAILSHELRTPLQSMLGWVRLLRRGVLDERGTERALETIDRNTLAQARIIEDLLDISRIIAGKLQIDLRPLNLMAVIDTAVESARLAASARNITIAATMDAAAAEVEGDPQRLQQVLSNLLSNALKFTPSGGLVEVGLERQGERARIAVRDSGVGIPDDVLPYIFDRFRQADSSSTRAHGGLGLGLAIVRHLVDLHHGTVRAESGGAARGATFLIELPLLVRARETARDRARGGEGRREEPTSLAGLRIVVVDDDADTRGLLAVALRTHGAEVSAAASAPEAMDAVARMGADVLISDISMPEQDGFSLIQTLRTGAGASSRIPAIALTALARAEDQERALAAGFQRSLAKPVDPVELASIVRALVAQR
jgi:signal transduction histidine kinase/ActR/RegA family two-component response regulator